SIVPRSGAPEWTLWTESFRSHWHVVCRVIRESYFHTASTRGCRAARGGLPSAVSSVLCAVPRLELMSCPGRTFTGHVHPHSAKRRACTRSRTVEHPPTSEPRLPGCDVAEVGGGDAKGVAVQDDEVGGKPGHQRPGHVPETHRTRGTAGVGGDRVVHADRLFRPQRSGRVVHRV